MSLLEKIHAPADLQQFSTEELDNLCGELRDTILKTVSHTGGHLASNLGVVELTVALHRTFPSADDRIVWDVGHQCYAHKLLTGRAAQFDQLRQSQGVSGFPRPAESTYDAFVAGHSSTSVSAANGLAKAKTLTGAKGHVIAVIGDGAMTGGLAYEGLCNAGRSDDRLIVVLNDNKMSISRNVGFVARYLSSLRSRMNYLRSKERTSRFLRHIPLVGQPLVSLIQNLKQKLKRSVLSGSTFFEDMGFRYLGPVDGHNLDDLHQALLAAKSIDRPVVLHIETVKGKGCTFAEKNPDTYHGISRFDKVSGEAPKGGESFSSRFGQALCRLAAEDDRIVAVTAAMKGGTGLSEFADRFPTRFFDTGIAEEHAVTFSSGMACGGLLPVFAVYSSFLQRSYDQLINDTSIMNNHIVLAIDRSGVVPDDGETHQGIYDVAMLRTVPHVTAFAPCNYKELDLHLRQAIYDAGGIAAVRYPKGAESPLLADYEPSYQPYDYVDSQSRDLLLVTYGRTFGDVLAVSRQRQQNGQPTSVLKLNRILPLEDEVAAIAKEYACVLVLEETSGRGGIGELLGSHLMQAGFTGRFAVKAMEDTLGACTTAQGLAQVGLDAPGIAAFIAAQTEATHE